MKLIFENIHHDYETESDYDTAVDLFTWRKDETKYSFSYDKKVLLTINLTLESTSHSYLEPDFEEEPTDLPIGGYGQDGKGNEYVYRTHPDPSKDTKKETFKISIFLPNPTYLYTQSDLLEVLKNKEDNFYYEEQANHQKFEYEILKNKGQKLNQALVLSNTEILQIKAFLKKDILNNKHKTGEEFDLPLPNSLINLIQELSDEAALILRNNFVKINQNEQNLIKAKQNLDQQSQYDNAKLNETLLETISQLNDNEDTADKVLQLINQGANFSLSNTNGDNAFMVACRQNKKIIAGKIVDEIIKKYNDDYLKDNLKFNLNKQNLKGDNALIMTVKNNNAKLAHKMLMSSQGFDVSLTNHYNKDASFVARERNNPVLSEFLQNFAASNKLANNLKNKNGLRI